MDIILMLMTVLALIVGIVSSLASRYFGRISKDEQPTLEDKVVNLTKNLKSAASVITELEREISNRKLLAQSLENDIKRYNQLREVSEAQVEAIAQTLQIPVARASRKSMIINGVITFLVALAFFTAGFFIGGR